jgi:tetratricopeptide (TPR) repeat protein
MEHPAHRAGIAGAFLITALLGCGQTAEKQVREPVREPGGVPVPAVSPPTDPGSAYAEHRDDAEPFIDLAMSRQGSDDGGRRSSAYQIEGGPVLLHISVYNDWEFEGLGRRRTLLFSQCVFPEVEPVHRGESDEAPQYTFATAKALAVVTDGEPMFVDYQQRIEVRYGSGASSQRSTFHLPILEDFSRAQVRTRRSFTIEELKNAWEHTPYFKDASASGTTYVSLPGRRRLEEGVPITLFGRHPIEWGPDDTPLVLEVTAMRLPLPAEYDAATLNDKIAQLRDTVRREPSSAASRFLLATCLDMSAAVSTLDDPQRATLREEAIEQMEQAVELEPARPQYRDRLRWAFISAAYRSARTSDYAQASERIERMLQLDPPFADWYLAARVLQLGAASARADGALDDARRAEERGKYDALAADALRRGLALTLEHGGTKAVDYQRRHLAPLIGSAPFSDNRAIEKVLAEFETDPAVLAGEIERLESLGSDAGNDAETDHLLAAHYAMSAELGKFNDPGRRELFETATKHARRAMNGEPENVAYRRCLRELLLKAGRALSLQNDYEGTRKLVEEALRLDPTFENYVEGAAILWLTGMPKVPEDPAPEKDHRKEAQARRDKYVATLDEGLAALRKNRPHDYPWLVEQLPAAVPYPVSKWAEFKQLIERARLELPARP